MNTRLSKCRKTDGGLPGPAWGEQTGSRNLINWGAPA